MNIRAPIRRRMTGLVLFAILLGISSAAQAQQADAPKPQEKAPEPVAPTAPEKTWRRQDLQLQPENVKETWYGYQTLLLGSATFALTLAGSYGTGNPAFYVGGGSAMILEPAIVHLIHGSASKAGWSIMLMVGTAAVAGVAGGLIGPATCDSSKSDMCGLAVIGGFMWGSLIGTLAGNIIDATWLAYDETPVNPPPPKADKTSFNLVPQVWVGKDQTTFGVVGQF